MAKIWTATDVNGNECQLASTDGKNFVLSMVEGSFRGYPEIVLTWKQMDELKLAIEDFTT